MGAAARMLNGALTAKSPANSSAMGAALAAFSSTLVSSANGTRPLNEALYKAGAAAASAGASAYMRASPAWVPKVVSWAARNCDELGRYIGDQAFHARCVIEDIMPSVRSGSKLVTASLGVTAIGYYAWKVVEHNDDCVYSAAR